MVKRLGFSIPEFIRTIWVSEEARSTWEPRISAVSRMFQQLEIIAVRSGLKPATLQSCSPEALPTLMAEMMEWGLVCLPLSRQGVKECYSNASVPFDDKKPWAYRVVIGRPDIVSEFNTAWHLKDDGEMGSLLGFPTCCQGFFHHYWNNEGFRDLTYPMVLEDRKDEKRHYEIKCATSNNILLRWLGVRRVSHLPCSFRCEATRTIGDSMQEIADSVYPEESRWLTEMLTWPVRWSSLHGVAIITIPVLRIVTSSDALAESVVVDKVGTSYPAEGAAGIDFPFQESYPIKLNRRGVSLHTDNGFESEEGMTKSHDVLLRALDHAEVPAIKRVVDLGCGNGVLLEKIAKKFDAELFGVEIDKEKCRRGNQRLRGTKITLFQGDLRQYHYWQPPYGLTVMALNRLFEMPVTRAHDLLEKIARGSEYLLAYSYDGKEFDISWSDHWRMEYSHSWDDEPKGSTVVYLLRSLYGEGNDKFRGGSPVPGPENQGRDGSNDGGGNADEDNQRRQDDRGTEGFVPDWASRQAGGEESN